MNSEQPITGAPVPEQKLVKTKKSTKIGWLSIVAAFVLPPWGALVGVFLACIALESHTDDHLLPKIGLVFSGSILALWAFATYGTGM